MSSYMYFINSDDHETATSLVKKLSGNAKPGAIILLNTKEMNLAKDMMVIDVERLHPLPDPGYKQTPVICNLCGGIMKSIGHGHNYTTWKCIDCGEEGDI